MVPHVRRPRTQPAREGPTLPPVRSSVGPFVPRLTTKTAGNRRTLLLRVLGVVLAMGGGIALGYAATSPVLNPVVAGWWLLAGLVVGGALLAMLLRSWWALLLLPVVVSVGVFVGTVIEGGGFDFHTLLPTAAEATYLVVLFVDVPLLVGVAIGTPLGRRLEQRMSR